MRKTAVVLIAFLLSATPAFAKVKVVATLPWIGSVANEIGKGQVEVTTLVKPNQDPHLVEARPSMILATRKADILMYNGLDLEIGYLPVLIESSRNPNIQPGKPGNFDGSHFVTVLEKPVSVDRSMGDVHPLGNPHYHYSARNILAVAEGMANALSTIDPSHADSYKVNLASFQEKVRVKQKEWSGFPLKGKKYVAYHKYFEYLAADFGLKIMAYVEPKPGIPPSAGIHRTADRDDQGNPAGRNPVDSLLWPAGSRISSHKKPASAASSFPTTWGRYREPTIGSPSWTRRFRHS